MKNEKKLPVSIEEKSGPGSDPVNKFKKAAKAATAASIDNIINPAVGNVQARAGSGLTDEGTVVFYNEERL